MKEQIIEMYKKGISCRKIAEELQLSCHKQVSKILKESGITLLSKSDRAKIAAAIRKPRIKKEYFCTCGNLKSNKKNKLCRKCWKFKNKTGPNSFSYKGGVPNCKECGVKLSTYGLKTKLCRSCHDKICGEFHWNWKGGVSKRCLNSKQYKTWRNKVFERDNFSCQRCGRQGIYLHAHHIVRWTDSESLRFKISNGMTLCQTCHKIEHGWKVSENELMSVYPANWGA